MTTGTEREHTTGPCGRFVSWWDGEYEGNCRLPSGHDGDHYDGLSWFNDDNEMTDHLHVTPPGS